MKTTYKVEGSEYTIDSMVDIENDYINVTTLVSVDENYLNRMNASKLRYRVLEGNKQVACMYLDDDKHRAEAITLMATDIYGLMVLWYHIYNVTDIKQVKVVPHSKSDIRKYISIATGQSVRGYNIGTCGYLLVDLRQLKDRMEKVFTDKVEICQ